MKKYVNSISQLMKVKHPDSECSCYNEFGLDEDFLCDLCLSRLRAHRKKVKRRLRMKFKSKYNKYSG